jgi:hypothetical protein
VGASLVRAKGPAVAEILARAVTPGNAPVAPAGAK